MDIFELPAKLKFMGEKISAAAKEMVSDDVRYSYVNFEDGRIKVKVNFGTKMGYYPTYVIDFDSDGFLEGSSFGDNDYPSPVYLGRNIGFEKTVLKILRGIL
jgi:hypothetical protein